MTENRNSGVPPKEGNYMSPSLIREVSDVCIKSVNKTDKFVVQTSAVLSPQKTTDKNVPVPEKTQIKTLGIPLRELCRTLSIKAHDTKERSIYISLDKNSLNHEKQVCNNEHDNTSGTKKCSFKSRINCNKVIVIPTDQVHTLNLFRTGNGNLDLEPNLLKVEDYIVVKSGKQLQTSYTEPGKKFIVENTIPSHHMKKSKCFENERNRINISDAVSKNIGPEMIVKGDKISTCSLEICKNSPVINGIISSVAKVNAVTTDQNTILLTRSESPMIPVRVLNSGTLKNMSLPSVTIKQLNSVGVLDKSDSQAEKCFSSLSALQSSSTSDINENNFVSKIVIIVLPASNQEVLSAVIKKEENSSLIFSQTSLSSEFYHIPAKITKSQESNGETTLLPKHRDMLKVTKFPVEREILQFDGKSCKTYRRNKRPVQSVIPIGESLTDGIGAKTVNSSDELTAMYKRLSEAVPVIAQPVEVTRISVPQIPGKNVISLRCFNKPCTTQISKLTNFRKGPERAATIYLGKKSTKSESVSNINGKSELMSSESISAAASSLEMLGSSIQKCYNSVPSVIPLNKPCQLELGTTSIVSEVPPSYQVQFSKEKGTNIILYPCNLFKGMLLRERYSQVNNYKYLKVMEEENVVLSEKIPSQEFKFEEGNSLRRMTEIENTFTCKTDVTSSEQSEVAKLNVTNTINALHSLITNELMTNPSSSASHNIGMNATDGMISNSQQINRMTNKLKNYINKSKITKMLQPVSTVSGNLKNYRSKNSSHILDSSVVLLHAEKDGNILFSVLKNIKEVSNVNKNNNMSSGKENNTSTTVLTENNEDHLLNTSLKSCDIGNEKESELNQVQIKFNKSSPENTISLSNEIKGLVHEDNSTSEKNILIEHSHIVPAEIVMNSGIKDVAISNNNSENNNTNRMVIEYGDGYTTKNIMDKEDHDISRIYQLIENSEMESFSSQNLEKEEVSLCSVDSARGSHDHEGGSFLKYSLSYENIIESATNTNFDNLVPLSEREEHFPAIFPREGHLSIVVEPHSVIEHKIIDYGTKMFMPHIANEELSQSCLQLISAGVEGDKIVFQEDTEELSSSPFKNDKLPSISCLINAAKKDSEIDAVAIHKTESLCKEYKSHIMGEDAKFFLKDNSTYESHHPSILLQDSASKLAESEPEYIQMTDDAELLRCAFNNENLHDVQKEGISLSHIQEKYNKDPCTSSAEVMTISEVIPLQQTSDISIEAEIYSQRCNNITATYEKASTGKEFYFTNHKALEAQINTSDTTRYEKEKHYFNFKTIEESKTETNTCGLEAHEEGLKHGQAHTFVISHDPSSFEIRYKQLDDTENIKSFLPLSSDYSHFVKCHSIDNYGFNDDKVQIQNEIKLYAVSHDACEGVQDKYKHLNLNNGNLKLSNFRISQNSQSFIQESENVLKSENKTASLSTMNLQTSDRKGTQVKLQNSPGGSDIAIQDNTTNLLPQVSLQVTAIIAQNKSEYGKINTENKGELMKNSELVGKDEQNVNTSLGPISLAKNDLMSMETVCYEKISPEDDVGKLLVKNPKDVSEVTTEYSLNKDNIEGNTSDYNEMSYPCFLEDIPQNRNKEYDQTLELNCGGTVTLTDDTDNVEEVRLPSPNGTIKKHIHSAIESQICLENSESGNKLQVSVNDTVIEKVLHLDKTNFLESNSNELKITAEGSSVKVAKITDTCFRIKTPETITIEENIASVIADENMCIKKYVNESEANNSFLETGTIVQTDVNSDSISLKKETSKKTILEEEHYETQESGSDNRKFNEEIIIFDEIPLMRCNKNTTACTETTSSYTGETPEMIPIVSSVCKYKLLEKTKKRVDRRKQSLEELRLPEDFMRLEVLSTIETESTQTDVSKVGKTHRQQKSLSKKRRQLSGIQKRKSVKKTKLVSKEILHVNDSRHQNESISVNSDLKNPTRRPESLVHKFSEIPENVDNGDKKNKIDKISENLKDDLIKNLVEKATKENTSKTAADSMSKVSKKDCVYALNPKNNKTKNKKQGKFFKDSKSHSPKKSALRAFTNTVQTNIKKDESKVTLCNKGSIFISMKQNSSELSKQNKGTDLPKGNDNLKQKLDNKNRHCTVKKILFQRDNLTFQKRRSSNRLKPVVKTDIKKRRKVCTGFSGSSILQILENSCNEPEKYSKLDFEYNTINKENKSKTNLILRKKQVLTSRKCAKTTDRGTSVSDHLEINFNKKARSLQIAASLKKSCDIDSLPPKRKARDKKDKSVALQNISLRCKAHLQQQALKKVQIQQIADVKSERKFLLRNRKMVSDASIKCALPNSRVVSKLKKGTKVTKRQLVQTPELKEPTKQKKGEKHVKGKQDTRSQKKQKTEKFTDVDNVHAISNKNISETTFCSSRIGEADVPKKQLYGNQKERLYEAMKIENSSAIIKCTQPLALKNTKIFSITHSNLKEIPNRILRNKSIEMANLNLATEELVKNTNKVSVVNEDIPYTIKPDYTCRTRTFEENVSNMENVSLVSERVKDITSVDVDSKNARTDTVEINDKLASIDLQCRSLKLTKPEFECQDLSNTSLVPFQNNDLNITNTYKATEEPLKDKERDRSLLHNIDPLELANAFEEISEFGEKNKAVKVTHLTEQDLHYTAETTRSLLVLEPSYGCFGVTDIGMFPEQNSSEVIFDPPMNLPDTELGSFPQSKWPLTAKEKKCYGGKKRRENFDFDEDLDDDEAILDITKGKDFPQAGNTCKSSFNKKCYPGKRQKLDSNLKIINKNFIESPEKEELCHLRRKLNLEMIASMYDIDFEKNRDSEVIQTYAEFKASKSGKSICTMKMHPNAEVPFHLRPVRIRRSPKKYMEYETTSVSESRFKEFVDFGNDKDLSFENKISVREPSIVTDNMKFVMKGTGVQPVEKSQHKSELIENVTKKIGRLETHVRRTGQPYHIPPHLLGRSVNDPTSDVTERSRPMQRPRMGVKVPYRNLTSQIVTSKEIVKELLERSRARNTAIAMMMNKKVADCVGRTFNKPLSSSLARYPLALGDSNVLATSKLISSEKVSTQLSVIGSSATTTVTTRTNGVFTQTMKEENLNNSSKKTVIGPIPKTQIRNKELERTIALKQLAELLSKNRKQKNDEADFSVRNTVSRKTKNEKLNLKNANGQPAYTETINAAVNKQNKIKKKRTRKK